MESIPQLKPNRFEKICLTNVRVWARAQANDKAIDWLDGEDSGEIRVPPYAITSVPFSPESIPRAYVMLKPDGSLWKEGTLYLYERALQQGTKSTTASNIAGDLAHFMNAMRDSNKDFLDFEGPSFRRPTYRYKITLQNSIKRGELSRLTANRKISSMIGLYRWLTETRNFKPQQSMWTSKIRNISYEDRFGFRHTKAQLCTDLTFKNAQSISTGEYIEDGGKLYPISRDNQTSLMKALVNLDNPEMLLVHVIALVTGMRIQSILTLRHHSIKQNLTEKDDKTLTGLKIGMGSSVEAKGQKAQTVLIPGWLHNQLSIYINSERYKERMMKSRIKGLDGQYLFTTRTGRPYYIAEEDKELYDYSSEAGSAIRFFKTRIKEELKRMGEHFNFRFHDLRATFGMNLIEDYLANPNNNINQLALIDLVKSRLNQNSIVVTMRYLKFRETHSLVAQAQSEFEDHLRDIVIAQRSKYGLEDPPNSRFDN
ncbi:site-specific integrase [Pseudomonas sp. MH9.2]|uniref:site-specific integrase n=1 Tax=Pseudomonas sp. MH9.2 TaxID=3048629 RepID=UPI002AC90A12|nr:site-specific integrase [Pseudomonas sp. MH9.2]MEB0024794.1 site-specific integrase [Pseudomonas sp. MH9.2]WPX70651.1 site-specific integrase [Pseudomonas sp. MH9.2]